jgi:hypothetical protein
MQPLPGADRSARANNESMTPRRNLGREKKAFYGKADFFGSIIIVFFFGVLSLPLHLCQPFKLQPM